MKVITWNTWGGRKIKTDEDLFPVFDTLCEVISKENPDILALQEVRVQNNHNMAQYIAGKLGLNIHFCETFTTDRHTPAYSFGNAILSKYLLEERRCHMLSTLQEYTSDAETEPRGATEATIHINDKRLRIVTVHMGYSKGFIDSEIRDKQLEKLLEVIGDSSCVLLGDFNSRPDTKIIQLLNDKLTNTDPEMKEITYIDQKTIGEKERIDYIFTQGDIKTSNFKIIETPASDHYPLVCEVEL